MHQHLLNAEALVAQHHRIAHLQAQCFKGGGFSPHRLRCGNVFDFLCRLIECVLCDGKLCRLQIVHHFELTA